MKLFFVSVIVLFCFSFSFAEIDIKNKSVTAWKRDHLITGSVNIPSANSGKLFVNGSPVSFNITENSFSVPVKIGDGENIIYAIIDSSGIEISSDTIIITLGYKVKPEVFAYAEVNGTTVELHSTIIENPDNSNLIFYWQADPENRAPLEIINANDSSASVNLSQNSPPGEYYFNLFTVEEDGDTAKARTFITIDDEEIKPFDIKNDYAAWIDSAVIYEITPYVFTEDGNFNKISAKIPELVELGVNTIWIQPVYSTNGKGQGYDITNYFKVRPDLGSESDLRNLIKTAKSYGLKVLFDFVANHSSIHHPYAKASSADGEDSYYWNFYQRTEDNAPYSQHYQHYNGFINYFWDELPNLNFDNPEVQKWITEATKYWIENFGIDGYRFDAIWGVNARKPEFTKELRLALKRIKPEILMLAEDKATHPHVFDERFDAAYDWTASYDWVSQWVWQTDYDPSSNPTIFLASVTSRAGLLRRSLNNDGNGYAPDARILRFTGNNDIYYFSTHHGVERTKMAAGLVFMLNGIPLIYNGEEIGKTGHPYNLWFIFQSNRKIKDMDSKGLFSYYQRLITLKKQLSALHTNNFEEVKITPGSSAFAFRRWSENQNVFCAVNMASSKISAALNLPVDKMNLDSTKTYYLTDMFTGESYSGLPESFKEISFPIDGYTTRMFLFADTTMNVTGIDDFVSAEIPSEFKLEQNYPNPFNPVTKIKFSTNAHSKISLRIYDVLGNEVASLIDDVKPAGEYEVEFDGSNLASGIYLYRLQAGTKSFTKKMMLLK